LKAATVPRPKKPAPVASPEVLAVFDYWRETMKHPSAKLDAKRTATVGSALGLGYSVDDLKAAILGCSRSPFHRGENDRKTVYDSLALIFRDADKIDGFIGRKAPQMVMKPMYDDTENERIWLEKKRAAAELAAASSKKEQAN
jgi:hypothetical protein